MLLKQTLGLKPINYSGNIQTKQIGPVVAQEVLPQRAGAVFETHQHPDDGAHRGAVDSPQVLGSPEPPVAQSLETPQHGQTKESAPRDHQTAHSGHSGRAATTAAIATIQCWLVCPSNHSIFLHSSSSTAIHQQTILRFLIMVLNRSSRLH